MNMKCQKSWTKWPRENK